MLTAGMLQATGSLWLRGSSSRI